MSAPRNDDHVVMRGDGFTCLHCGDHQSITIPQLVESMAAMGIAWAKVHAKCPKPAAASPSEEAR